MFESITKINERKLWKHQAEALSFAINHLNALDSPCLIRMPTGTGKTGIIACLTRLSSPGTSLVLTPWANLREQLLKDVQNDFWQKVGLVPNNHKVCSMLPTTASQVLEVSEPQVIIATFATLNNLRLRNPDLYSVLSNVVSLVIVDECHYEPAVKWGKSVKELKTKTVLLTATPYRNDLKLFRISDPDYSSRHFTHKEAVGRKIIRHLAIQELNARTDIKSLSKAFVEKWKDLKSAQTLPSSNPRAIICCSGAGDIEEVVIHLRKAGLNAIGLHEQFKSSDGSLRKDVPDPKDIDSEIWVHQNKLTEGLDDHRFCCLALFTRIHNDRKLIQQIGRVLRRDVSDFDRAAILLAPAEFSPKVEWSAYLEFETHLELLKPEHFRDIVNTLLAAQPVVEYFEGRFRRRFNPADLSINPQVIINPSVFVRSATKSFSLDEYIEECTDTLNTEDAVILGPDINAPCQKSAAFALWVYASFRNSRFLHDTSLYEIKLETHCVVLSDELVFMADSRGNFPTEYVERHTRNVPLNQLSQYLDESFRPTHVSIGSSIPYETIVRGADLRGHNLLSIPASLTDRVQICRSARGRSSSDRRYVGMSKGHLRKEISKEVRLSFELNNYVSWVKSVARILKSNVGGSELFDRFMPTCAPPEKAVPKTISIDFLMHDLILTLTDGSECMLKSTSADIKETVSQARNTYIFSFELEGNGTNRELISLRLEYQPSKKRFWFHKESGLAIRVRVNDEGSSKSLAEFLNQNQDIVLIGLNDGETVYQGRNFYKVDYGFAEKVLLDLIEQPPDAPPCKTEKGTNEQINAMRRSRQTSFAEHSLFKTIADRNIDFPFSDDLLICDDLGSECADFVSADFDKHQMALIHAKMGSGRKISASAFHDIVAQAMKNLVYLTRSSEIPKGISSWHRNKKWNGTGIPRLYRMPDHLPSGKTLWNKMKSDIIISSNPELYVVLVTSGCCNLDELKGAVRDVRKRTPETAQLLHLLDGLNGYARQLGVRLVVYDLPYQLS